MLCKIYRLFKYNDTMIFLCVLWLYLSSVPQGTYLSSWSSICCISPSLRLLSQALSLQCPIFRVSWRFSGSHRWWPITNGHLWTTWVHCKWGKRELVTIKSTCMLPIVQITVLLFKKAQATQSDLEVFVDLFSQQHEVN